MSPKQSGLRSVNSCINQLLSINHEILSAFDIGLEFLDVSKAFDKVWLAELIYKLRQNDTCRDLINILNGFLTNRKERVVLNGVLFGLIFELDITRFHSRASFIFDICQ